MYKRIKHNDEQKSVLNTVEYGAAEAGPGCKMRRDGSYFFCHTERVSQKLKVLQAMGLMSGATNADKIPLEAAGSCTFGGVVVGGQYVPIKYVLTPSRSLELPLRKIKSYDWEAQKEVVTTKRVNVSTHRLHVECPYCGVYQPTGRLHQHIGSGVCDKAAALKNAA